MDIRSFDAVFMLILEDGRHWYSARIDYFHKRIDIYDSFAQRSEDYFKQSEYLWRKRKVMQVCFGCVTSSLSILILSHRLSFVAKALNEIRGEVHSDRSEPECDSTWVYDPYFQVCQIITSISDTHEIPGFVPN